MTTKFVILCQPRTGSSLLHATLRRHPQIVKHAEILNHRQKHDLPDEGYERLVAALNVDSHPAVVCMSARTLSWASTIARSNR